MDTAPPVDRVPPELWPALDEACILHETSELVFVDKPPFVPCQEAEPGAGDDLPTRLAALLGAREGAGPAYVGVHQRLDAATSGVLVYSKARAANARLAAAFEGRTAEKEYLAIVSGWRGPARTLTHHLAKGEDGRVVALDRPGRATQEAITHARIVRREGRLVLLALRLETGRTHQARVQLAAAGAPIVGDELYGGEPADRLYLHAATLRVCGQSVTAPTPAAFDDLLAGRALDPAFLYGPSGAPVLAARLAAAAERRSRLAAAAARGELSAFRLVNDAGDGLPGVAVDVYGRFAVLQLYEAEGLSFSPEAIARLATALRGRGLAGCYLKHRPKQANTLVDTRRDDVAPSAPVAGDAAPEPYLVVEGGVRYEVRLGDGLSTGLFLDMRRSRALLRERAAGRSVLNLFAYHCGFSVAAASGGARAVTSVDATLRSLERGRENFLAAGLDPAPHRFVAEDCFAWLERARKKGERYEVIVCDPPSYSKTKKTRFSAGSDYASLAKAVLQVLQPGGQVFFFCNHRGTTQARFRRTILGAARDLGLAVGQLKDLPTPPDYPAPAGSECHLKGVLFTGNPASRV